MILHDDDRIDVAINVNGRPMVTVPLMFSELERLHNRYPQQFAALLDARIERAMIDARGAFVTAATGEARK